MPVVLIRHTRLSVDKRTCYGISDIDVANSFDEESHAVAENLAKEISTCHRVISSPLLRCTKLAAVVADRFATSYTIDPRITEMDFGTWEGVHWSAIDRGELDAWATDFMHARPHGGESVAMLQSRAKAALTDYLESDETHVLVCHAGVIKVLLADGEAAEDFNAMPDYGEIVKL